MTRMKRYQTIEKKLGETPLEATERLRREFKIPENVPLAYAGRLDPMASGTLLILIGDECKRQTDYHSLDKEYTFEILFGAHSDTADILGLLDSCTTDQATKSTLSNILAELEGDIELPYPHYSSKTVGGKPLHVWTLEGRLNEIEIPTKKSYIYKLKLDDLYELSKQQVYKIASENIETVTKVTVESKALGRDFRRNDVRASWKHFYESNPQEQFQIARISCIASSGTYMRTLAEIIGKKSGGCGLAWSIERNTIGNYWSPFSNIGFWTKKF